jgi:ABC-type transporter Mla maintaining outer membrane lipid asymmetry ATPase subunit MlaF
MLVMNDGYFIAEGNYKELENSQDKLVKSFFN